jgi:glucokinase-like ROK family protein
VCGDHHLRGFDKGACVTDRLAPCCRALFRRLIVSCQAPDGDAYRDSESMARFARATAAGGAAGIRTNGVHDVHAIRKHLTLPIIGIQKRQQTDGNVLITPSFEDARDLVRAGADIIAIDCTARGQRSGALDRLRQVRTELMIPVMADIATLEEAVAAGKAGADLVASTMRGFTAETESVDRFEPAFIAAATKRTGRPVVAEGRIETPLQAADAIRAGAFAVVVGTAITRPQALTARFVAAIESIHKQAGPYAILAIDLGGTNTKCAVVDQTGHLSSEFTCATPPGGGREVLLTHVKAVVHKAVAAARHTGVTLSGLGVATAGWVDPRTGRVAYATENLPGWTGTPVADELQAETGLPVAVENDANALALAERLFGWGRETDDFVCITLGTGVGGGCFSAGRLNRGAHFFANALGHIPIQHDGLPCTCGRSGCLEVYANAAALVRYAGHEYSTAAEVIRSANSGSSRAQEALRIYASYLATGITSIVHLLDPATIVLSGGLAQDNPLLVSNVADELTNRLIAPAQRHLSIRVSALGYYAGVLGAAAVAMEKLGLETLP